MDNQTHRFEQDHLIELRELRTVIHSLVEEVHEFKIELKEFKFELKQLKEDQLPRLLVTHSVHGEKISRLEMLAYGSTAAIAVEGLGLLTALMLWLLTR